MQSLDELNEHLKRVSIRFNNRLQPHFEGYSPKQMHFILYDPYGPKSALKIRDISDQTMESIPFFMQALQILEKLEKAKEVKLTAKGYLPTSWVVDIYQNGYMKNEWIEKGIQKLYREMETYQVFIPRIVLGIGRLTKKRNGKLSITQKGRRLIQNRNELLKEILQTYTLKFNWAFPDGCGNHQLGQLGFAFSLILLSKYGKTWKKYDHYAHLYETAFPFMKQLTVMEYNMSDKSFDRCFSLRSFERFMHYFGLIELDKRGTFKEDIFVRKTEIFDKLIGIRKPNSYCPE